MSFAAVSSFGTGVSARTERVGEVLPLSSVSDGLASVFVFPFSARLPPPPPLIRGIAAFRRYTPEMTMASASA